MWMRMEATRTSERLLRDVGLSTKYKLLSYLPGLSVSIPRPNSIDLDVSTPRR